MKHDWEYKKLGEVAEIIGGSTPKTNVPEYWDGDYFWVTPAELKGDRFIKSTARTITDLAVNSTNLSLLPKGTVLLSSRAPIGKVAITDVPMYCNQGFKNVVCGNKLNNNYVYWLLYGKTEYLNSLGVGATFKEISKKIVENISIPVPPLPTQQSIVSELDSLFQIIADCKETLKDYDALEQSIFYDMFGDPVKNEKGWEVKKLGDVCDVRDGTHDSPKYVEKSDYILITSKNIVNGKIDYSNVNYITKEDYDAINQRSNVDNGDIIMAMIGTIGNPIIVKKEEFNFCIKNVALMKFKNSTDVNNIYIRALLDNKSYTTYIKGLNKGGTQKFIALGTIRSLITPVPPLPLQQQFASKIEAIEQMKAETKKALQEAETLFNARMDYWFN